jgi:hypothetical protein
VRIDLVDRLAEAVEASEAQPDGALARIIGRPVRDLSGVLTALGYRKAPAEEGAPARWRKARRGKPARKKPAPAPDNAFAALANLLPPGEQAPPRRRKSTPA